MLLVPLRGAHPLSRLREVVGESVRTESADSGGVTAGTHHEVAVTEEDRQAWPTTVGRFLSRVHECLGKPPLALRPAGALPVLRPGLHLHTVDPPTLESALLLKMWIFERVPEPFEVLWCDSATTLRSVETFVARMRENPERCFMMMQIEELTPTAQQALLRLLLSSRDMVHHNLHCIQMAPSILHSVTWVKHHKEQERTAEQDARYRQLLREWVVDGETFRSITLLTGGSGSGKTHESKKHLARWAAAGMQTCVISITEAFSPGAVAEQLRRKVLKHGNTSMGLSFHINLGKFRLAERGSWDLLMGHINRFFFDLLLLRSVDNPAGVRFNVPPGCKWDVLIEIPHRAGHLEEEPDSMLTTEAGIQLELPVLDFVAKKLSPPKDFDVNGEVKLVCKYLRAFEDGTIDQLYTSQGGADPKDVIFALDNSASMSKDNRLATCKLCLQNEIFNNKQVLGPEDRVGLVVFDADVNIDVPLGAWDAKQSAVEDRLRRVQCSKRPDGDIEVR
eukprot:1328503-Prymnesium_polylepis.1